MAFALLGTLAGILAQGMPSSNQNPLPGSANSPAGAHDPPRHHRRMETQERRAELESKKRALPPGESLSGAMARALVQTQKADIGPRLPYGPLGFNIWYAIGPAPINEQWNQYLEAFSGRVTAVAVDPLDGTATHWLIGTAQGGIWSTVNAGASWTPRTDARESLAMGAIAFAYPSSLVYAGTGEANFSADSYAGQGLLISRDRGNTWQMLNTNFAETSFSSIRVDPNNTNHLMVATTRGVAGKVAHGTDIPPTAPPRGVFVSTNGGTNFTRVLTGEATDLKTYPYNFQQQYAGLGEIYGSPANGVYRTFDGWTTPQLVNGPWASAGPANLGRIALAISSPNSDTVYVGIAYPRGSENGNLFGIWRSDNAWASTPTWNALPFVDNGPYLWYSFALTEDPNDANMLYYAGENVMRYNGSYWTSLTANIHADQHAMVWVPNGFDFTSYRMLLGNDGGVWLSTAYPVTASWNDLNANLALAQIYKGAVSPSSSSALALAGTQDNGTAANTGGTLAWPAVFGGDGCDVAISSSDPSQSWAYSWETLGGDVHILRTLNGGKYADYVVDGIDASTAPFFVHFEKSPVNDDLFIAGTVQLWNCTNFFSDPSPYWYSNSPVMLGADTLPVPISAMAFAPSDPSGLTYAFGTEDGQLRITSNGGGSWQDLNPADAVPQRYVTGLAFSPANSSVLYVTLSGFDESPTRPPNPAQPGHLFKTTNALALTPTWTNVSPPVDLPNNCLAIHPSSPNNLFVGTDIGVWGSADGGGTWVHYGPGSGMPNVAVFDLRMDSAGQPTAFTHGRGAFTLKPGFPIINISWLGVLIPPGCPSCAPGVNWINPGDRVSINLPLQNILPIDTVNLVATLMPSSQVIPITSSQTYGVLAGQGPAVSRTFSFQANMIPGGSCGDPLQVTFHLMDQSNDLGQVSIPFRLGTPRIPLSESFTEVLTGGLPPGWTSSPSGADAPWIIITNVPPNDPLGGLPGADGPGEPGDPPNSVALPSPKAFTPAIPAFGQSVLTSPTFSVATPRAQLSFRQTYSVSNGWDGCVLEIAFGSGPFLDIVSAGGSFVQDGYSMTLNDRNPLGLRRAWSGDSGGWLPVLVNLPPAAAGQPVQLRWHFATSAGVPGGGWFLDSVLVTEPQCLPPVTNPVILNPSVQSGVFSFAINTVNNRTYIIDYKTNLNDAAWQTWQLLSGNGSPQTVSTPVSSFGQLFFRFRVQ